MEVDHRCQVNDHYWTARVQGKALRCNLLTYEMMNFATSKYCVRSARIRSYSSPYFPAFGLNMERYEVSIRVQSKCGEIRTRIAPNTDTSTQWKLQENIYLGAVAKYGPGSIRHAGGKCIHVLNGAFTKPKDETQLVLYDGCGQNRLEFVFANGLIKLTKYNMCVKLKGGSTSSGTKVCFSYQLLPQFLEFTENLSLQWFYCIPWPVFSIKYLRKVFSINYVSVY